MFPLPYPSPTLLIIFFYDKNVFNSDISVNVVANSCLEEIIS